MEEKANFTMTPASMEAFVEQEKQKGISQNRVRRYPGYLACFYRFLPKEKKVTLESYLDFRKVLLEKGYAGSVVEKYLSCLNGYAAFMRVPQLAAKKSMADLRGMQFGYLTVQNDTGKRSRRDVVWQCICRCGNACEALSGDLLSGKKKSCGCLRKAVLQKANRYIDGTSLRSSLNERILSDNLSGYVGVGPKKDRWKATITFKGRQKYLGSYSDIKDAVKARARAKDDVIAESLELQKEYDRYLKPIDDMERPKQEKMPRPVLVSSNKEVHRSDNTSGHPGVTKSRGQWLAKITWKGVTYYLGRFGEFFEAVEARKTAEAMLKADPAAFAQNYESLRRRAANHPVQETSAEYLDAGSDS